MEVKNFSVFKILVDLLIISSFTACEVYELSDISTLFIAIFWFFSILSFIAAFSPLKYIHECLTKSRGYQCLFTELILSIILAYFGYVVLAIFGFISGYFLVNRLVNIKLEKERECF